MSAADAPADPGGQEPVPVHGAAVTWISQAGADAVTAAGGTTVGVPVAVPDPGE